MKINNGERENYREEEIERDEQTNWEEGKEKEIIGGRTKSRKREKCIANVEEWDRGREETL